MGKREKALELLKQIGIDGEYDNALPDDDESNDALQWLYDHELISMQCGDHWDFFYPTEHGAKVLRNLLTAAK